MVERYVRDVEAAGSNPVTSTTKKAHESVVYAGCGLFYFLADPTISRKKPQYLDIMQVKMQVNLRAAVMAARYCCSLPNSLMIAAASHETNKQRKITISNIATQRIAAIIC